MSRASISGIQRAREDEELARRLATRLLLAISILIGGISLAGALLDVPALRDFKTDGHPARPLAIISYIAIALALGAPSRSGLRTVTALLAIPLVVIVYTALATGLRPGTLGQGVEFGRFSPPYWSAVAAIAMLTAAVALSRRHGRGFSRMSAGLACVTLGISLLSGLLVMTDITPPDSPSHLFLPSLPATAQAIAISGAVLTWSGWPHWAEIGAEETPGGKLMRRALPVVIVTPAAFALLEIMIVGAGLVSPLSVEVVMAGLNIAIFSGLIFWALSRVAAEHAARSETSEALGSAPIALVTPDGLICHWSRGCEELYGWTAAEAVGRRKYELLQSRDARSGTDVSGPADSTEESRELIEKRRDGTTITVIERLRQVEAEGRPPVIVHAMTDITDRVRVEAALKQSEATLALALNANNVGTVDLEMATGKLIVSAGMEKRLGLQPGDLSELKSWLDRIDPDDRTALTQAIAEGASQRREQNKFQFRMTTPDGGVRFLEGSGRFIYGASGGPERFLAASIDVTERNQREAALLVEQEQFRLVLQTVPSAMVIFDDTSIIRAFSASAERMFGYSAEEVIGQNVEVLAASPEIHKANSFIERYLKSGQSRVPDVMPVTYAKRRDGKMIPIELWMGDMWIADRRLFVAFCNDLTEQLKAEYRLGKIREELIHVSRLSTMGEMAAGLAHELNQPLAATVYFLGAADLVLTDNSNLEQGRALLRLGSEQALRAGEIIRRMRGFATREGVEMQVWPLKGIIDDAVAMSFLGKAKFDIDIVYDLCPEADDVLSDRIQIGQVLMNLLRNAIEELRKCAPNGRTITISTKLVDPETTQVSVADTGPGIDETMLDKLYMPFVSSTSKVGMGVGLSICRRIIEEHGGTFDAANNPGGGAVFRFTLSHISPEPSEPVDDDA